MATSAVQQSVYGRVQEADFPHCPKCTQLLHRVTAVAGSFIMTCPNLVPRPAAYQHAGEKRTERCGQVVHIVAIEGVAIVTPVSKDKLALFQRTYPIACEVYRELGILPPRPQAVTSEAPSFPCTQCRTPTLLPDLFAGVCRKCAIFGPDAS